MDIKKITLYMALALVLFALWSAWQKDYPVHQAAPTTQATTTATTTTTADTTTTTTSPAITQLTTIPANRIVHVHTNVLDLDIDTLGGNVINTKLPKYSASLNTPDVPVQILSNQTDNLYVAQSGIQSAANGKPIQYSVAQKDYTLQPNAQTLDITLTGRNQAGLKITKTFHFSQDNYTIDINYQIANTSSKAWAGKIYNQIVRKKPGKIKGFSYHTFTGAAISSSEKPYEKISYKKMDQANLSRDISGGWTAMQQRYFLTAWVPDQSTTHHYYSRVTDQDIYTVGIATPVNIASGQQISSSSKLYVGPEIAANLKPLAKGLDLTINYGWLWPISVAIFWVMQKIFNVVGNWGWSIVIITLLIKLIFYKFSETSYRSMAKMRVLAPQMKALQERYKDDRQKLSQATMELYRKEKANPISGCLPMIIQIPFFIALYYVLIAAVQFRHAPFIFWIHDLSVKDPYYILPILMGLSMLLTTKLNPAPPDPTQAKMMMLLPVVFTVLFISFPAGLVLYWLVNNLASALQQWYIMKRYEHTHPRRK